MFFASDWQSLADINYIRGAISDLGIGESSSIFAAMVLLVGAYLLTLAVRTTGRLIWGAARVTAAWCWRRIRPGKDPLCKAILAALDDQKATWDLSNKILVADGLIIKLSEDLDSFLSLVSIHAGPNGVECAKDLTSAERKAIGSKAARTVARVKDKERIASREQSLRTIQHMADFILQATSSSSLPPSLPPPPPPPSSQTANPGRAYSSMSSGKG